MKKRIISSLLAAMLVFSLAGCSGESSNSNASAATDSTSASPSPPAVSAAMTLKSTTLICQVISIDGSEITLSLYTPSVGGSELTAPDGDGANLPFDDSAPENTDSESYSKEENELPSMDGLSSKSTDFVLTINDESILVSDDDVESPSLSDISEESILTITFDESGDITSISIGTASENNLSSIEIGTAAATINSDTQTDSTEYTSSSDNENALRIENGAIVTINDIILNKTGETSSTENSDFYGLNAGLLAYNGSNVTITGGTVTTDGSGANGVFSYGSDTSVSIYNTVIRTNQNNSGGIELAGGGSINAFNLDVETQGNSSAAIRSDRGGGTLNVSEGKYVTNGTGSPAIYSTANIQASNSVLHANNSEAVVVEGANSVTLTDCTLTSAMTGTYEEDEDENLHAVMLYQSMSGDADVGHSSFIMTGGGINNDSGDVFYITNTAASVILQGVNVNNYADGNFLTVAGNDGSHGWGEDGSNGGTCELELIGQTVYGSIYVDSISSLNFSLTNESNFTGSINADGESGGEVSISIPDGCTWTLTSDSYITSFAGNTSTINTNGYNVYVNGVPIV